MVNDKRPIHNDPDGTVTEWPEDLDDDDVSWLEPLPDDENE